MALDTTGVHTRRALLAGTVGGLAALAARALGQPAAVEAHDPDDVQLGSDNVSVAQTLIYRTDGFGIALDVEAVGVGTALWGGAVQAEGVVGNSHTGIGVLGQSGSGSGVTGRSPHIGVTGRSTGKSNEHYGVYGESKSPTARGVFGRSISDAGGTGAWGQADAPGGVGLRGLAWNAKGGTGGYGTGVIGSSGSQSWPAPIANTGVLGVGRHGRGGVFKGDKAQVRLIAAPTATHPASGSMGDLYLDINARLWFCKGGTTWKQIA